MATYQIAVDWLNTNLGVGNWSTRILAYGAGGLYLHFRTATEEQAIFAKLAYP